MLNCWAFDIIEFTYTEFFDFLITGKADKYKLRYFKKLKHLLEEFTKEHCLLNDISSEKNTIKQDKKDLKQANTCKKRFWVNLEYETQETQEKYKNIYPIFAHI